MLCGNPITFSFSFSFSNFTITTTLRPASTCPPFNNTTWQMSARYILCSTPFYFIQLTTNNNNSHTEKDNTSSASSGSARRASSMKVVLGVRKSCDASIVYPNRQLASSPSSSSTAAHLNHHKVSPASNEHSQLQQQPASISESNEVNLETAIQSKLNVAHVSKPRSRSLIWRPNRKSQRSSNDGSDCRVS